MNVQLHRLTVNSSNIILTGEQHGGAPAYKCDSGAGYWVWKDNDGRWKANHEDDGDIGGNDHIRIEL